MGSAPLARAAANQAPWVSGYRSQRADGVGDGLHLHAEGQLTWVSAGVQRVWTEAEVRVTPPSLAVWIPGHTLHDSAHWGPGVVHRVQLDPETCRRLPAHSCAVEVSSQLKQALIEVTEATVLDLSQPDHQRLRDRLLAEIVAAPIAPLRVVLTPRPRLEPVMGVLLHRPADDRSIEDWARFLGSSSRALTRAFQRELGMSFRSWRRQIRLLHALHGLAESKAVSEVAHGVGYDSVSMFISAFRANLGTAPGQYYPRAASSSQAAPAQGKRAAVRQLY